MPKCPRDGCENELIACECGMQKCPNPEHGHVMYCDEQLIPPLPCPNDLSPEEKEEVYSGIINLCL